MILNKSWFSVLQEINTIINCNITPTLTPITPTLQLALLNIFEEDNKGLCCKELIMRMLNVARATYSLIFWRDITRTHTSCWYTKTWESALLEKLTNKRRNSRGQKSKGKFLSVWYDFIVYINYAEHHQSPAPHPWPINVCG